MIWYSRYFFQTEDDKGAFETDRELWIKVYRMLNDYQHTTRDLKEAIAYAKVVSLSCGVVIEVLQQEYHLATKEKSWWCVASVNGIKVKLLGD